MAVNVSNDAVEVYRGREDRIKDERYTPITNGRIYFATDTDKVFYDADNIRHEISGGGDVSFISATSAPSYEGETGYYVFQRSSIKASKLAIDNIILAPEADNAIYRVLVIDEGAGVVKTKQIAGGGGGGGGLTNPLSFTILRDFPERTIDTQDVTCVIKINSIITTDDKCMLRVFVNDQEVTELGSVNADLRVEREVTIPHDLFTTRELNVVEFVATVDDNEKSKKMYFYAFHSEFGVSNFNPRQPYGTDIGTGIVNSIVMNYQFSGLTNIKGHLHMYIDGEELFDLSDEQSVLANRYGGGAITGDGQLLIPCTIDEFAFLEHGNHTLTLSAYAVVDNNEYFVDSLSWDIIWTTPQGENTPIIVSSYNKTSEENYNIINIPYVVYAKGTENITVHLYVNGDELPTSPITVQYDKGMGSWNIWAISKYIPNIVNNFMLVAEVEGKTASKQFDVEIIPSALMLDAESKDLLLYLSALDRSNKESAVSRQTWSYTNSNGATYQTNFYNFNWNNDGWQLDDNGDNVLRLNNGAYIEIPFTGIMQEDKPNPGFTIETEFRCRNATSFAKLMTYSSVATQDTDEYGNLLWEQEEVIGQDGEPIMTYVLDSDGNRVQVIDLTGHLAYSYQVDSETTITLYEHEDSDGHKTYYLEDNVLYVDENDTPIIPSSGALSPIYQMTPEMQDKLDDQGNKIPIMVQDGAVEKTINYVTNQNGTKSVANAVGTFFSNEVGMCIGTQEAFFASTGKKVNVRYADNDKVKVSIVVDGQTNLLYIYINAVLSGVERFGDSDNFKAQGVQGLRFNSDYCDLDLYTIRIYKQALNFDGIVQNWIGDAPNLEEKRKRYLENHITKEDERNHYITLDYDLTKALSARMTENYKAQIAAGINEGDTQLQPGLPIMVITTYPTRLSNDTKSDLLPYNKAIKKYVDMRFWDPNYDPTDPNNTGVQGFKVQDFELSVQGTSSQGYPRRNYKAKVKATKADTNLYASKYPFYFTTWDGKDENKDIWPTFDYPNEPEENATAQEIAQYEEAYEAAVDEGWNQYAIATGGTLNETTGKVTGGYKQLKKLDIGNGIAETSFCFKADYMDSSSTHNTSLADYIDIMCRRTDSYDLTHPMKKIFGADKKYRQTIYGFPMLVFWDHKGQGTKPEFVGRYNFNIDKSATTSFGFTLTNEHPILKDVDYLYYKTKVKNGEVKKVKDDFDNLTPITVHGNPTIADICECWELTSNQHGFTGFRRNDWDALDDQGQLDFYNFWENRYHIMDFDPEDVYKGDSSPTKANAIANLKLYAKNIMDLSKWIYSTDVHPWDTDDETSLNHHKLTQVHNAQDIKFHIDPEDRTKVILLRDYFNKNNDGTTVTKLNADQFKLIYTPVTPTEPVEGENEPEITETMTLKVYYPQANPEDELVEMPFTLIFEDEINAVLDEPVFYITRDTQPMVTWDDETPIVEKAYFSAPDDEHPIPNSWYRKTEILSYSKIWDATNKVWVNDTSKLPSIVGYNTIIRDNTGKEYTMAEIYEKYTKDTKEYRLSKYHAEFKEHLNFDYCAFYFILTEFFILYDSREKNMMIATWGPETAGGNYIWYPIFYDMDTQLGINNSGTVYWDYDVNAQDEGLFSGAGSVLWDNFYACFLEEIKKFYRAMRDKGAFSIDECNKYYNTESADRWTPIIKNVDTFYKYVAPSIDAPGLRYLTKQGNEATTSSFFYCAQGDRTLNRSAFFRNRFNYKDSEWLGGSYRTQGGANIEMRYDANWTGTSDPNASDWADRPEDQAARADLESNATFDIKPYLTQYCSVYYDEIPREGGRFDIQQEPVVIDGSPDPATREKYSKNLDNIRKSGYVTIDPLPAIKETIETGLPLSQQLVYIYGPEYLRDLGDLSLKYLDRFFCQDAIRLNSLIIGNDNPYYKNTGIVNGAFELDTAYKTTSGTLNPNAKALLQYLDISNLSGLSGALDLSGCLKIKTIKALGTKYNTITLPDGTVIENLYLPVTTNTLVLNKAQRLSKVVRQRNRAIAYYMNGEPDPGLFIENITDRLNVSSDPTLIALYLSSEDEATKKTQIAPIIAQDPFYHNAANPYYVSMKHLDITAGGLGFLTYELLDYIVKQKIKMRYDEDLTNDTIYSKELKIRLLDVNWSPYEKLDSLAVDERHNLITDPTYYIRNDDLTYSELPSEVTFAYANKNLGGVYKKTNNRLSIDGGQTDTVLEGLPNLDILKMFVLDYQNTQRTNTNANNFYMFKDVYEDNNIKFLPHIGGEIYIDNTNPINEYELYNIAQTYSKVLANDDTPLTICAKNVVPCSRAKFIEIKLGEGESNGTDGIIPNGIQTTIATLRSNDASAAVVLPTDIARNDYDFRGWATYEAIQEYEPNFLKVENNIIIGNTGGVVTLESLLLDHLAVTIDQTDRHKTYENGASALLYGSGQTTYYAVFTLHKYVARYVLDIAKYLANPEDDSAYEDVLVPSNAYIDEFPPYAIPFYKNDELPIGKMHSFKGWASDLAQASEGKDRNLHFAIRKDMTFYPVYELINDAWNKPLDKSYLLWAVVNNATTGLEEVVIYGTTRRFGGRICLPKTIEGKPVTRIMGAGWQNSKPTGWKVLKTVTNGITVPLDGANGIQDNINLEHIYLQGSQDGTCNVRVFDEGAFGRMLNLTYIDIPLSLEIIEQYCFYNDAALAIRDLSTVKTIGMYALRFCNTRVEDPYNDPENSPYIAQHQTDLFLGGGEVSISNNALQGCGWETIHLGSANNKLQIPYARRTIHSSRATDMYYDPLRDEYIPVSIGRLGVNEIIITTAVETQSNYANTSITNTQGIEITVVN